jgi:enoyl-[acyl-carrier-protein] reductase (NADH)
MEKPGLQSEMAGPEPQNDQLPTEDGGYQTYKAAGKLQGKKALITGGDSGIGRAVAILFAMEGADIFIVYLAEEEKDAQETKRRVEEYGQKCHLMVADLTSREMCKKVVDEAISTMNTVNILVNNAAYQNMVEDIKDLSEDVPNPYLYPPSPISVLIFV